MYEFRDRIDAGRQLGQKLIALHGENLVVLGLPRGGVPVAAEVAMALEAPLDVIVVRKLGVPFQPEVAMGAIGEGGARVIDPDVMAIAGVTDVELLAVEQNKRVRLGERVARYRHGRVPADLHGHTAVIVNDGIAIGSTARVACWEARALGAEWVVLAVSVAPATVTARLKEADEVICLLPIRNFRAVGSTTVTFLRRRRERLCGFSRRLAGAPPGPGFRRGPTSTISSTSHFG